MPKEAVPLGAKTTVLGETVAYDCDCEEWTNVMGLALVVFVSAVTVANPSREHGTVSLLVTAIAKPALLMAACPLAPNLTDSAPVEHA